MTGSLHFIANFVRRWMVTPRSLNSIKSRLSGMDTWPHTLICREVSYHSEAYVRRSVLYAVSCVLVALHPSCVASALIEGNQEVSSGLEWARVWALQITESDSDSECFSVRVQHFIFIFSSVYTLPPFFGSRQSGVVFFWCRWL